MAGDNVDDMLRDGWEVAGYSTSLTALGLMVHSVLLKKGTWLRAVTVVTKGGKEVSRETSNL